MSMVNLCDLLGAFISGHLQRHFRANIIGLGCAILIILSLITASYGVWYDHRHNIDRKVTNEKPKQIDRMLLKNCWPIRICTKNHRGSFRVIA